MIIITPDAARELVALAAEGGPSILKLDASPEDDGYQCSVAMVAEMPDEASVEEIEGVTVAFCGMADAVFAGAVVGLTPGGELAVELSEGDCDNCGEGGCGCGGSCGSEGHDC